MSHRYGDEKQGRRQFKLVAEGGAVIGTAHTENEFRGSKILVDLKAMPVNGVFELRTVPQKGIKSPAINFGYTALTEVSPGRLVNIGRGERQKDGKTIKVVLEAQPAFGRLTLLDSYADYLRTGGNSRA